MKLTYIHQYFVFPELNGGTRSYDLALSFVKKGYDVEIVTSSANLKGYTFSQKWTRLERDGLVVNVLNLNYDNRLSYAKRAVVFFKFLWFSTFKVLQIKSDIVLATSTPLTIGIPALIKKWIQGTPFIFEIRDVWPEAVIAIGAINNKMLGKILYFLEKTLYRNAAALVPLSSDMKHSITTRYPFLSDKPIEIIENISEINRFNSNIDNDKSIVAQLLGFKPRFSVLYAGTFGRVNGLNYVLDLASKTQKIDSSIVYILLGDGLEKENIIESARTMGLLNTNVFVLNSISKNELPQLYSECDMGSSFVINIKELWANSANKFFDTLAAGRPILINHEGWQADVINSDNLGYVLPTLPSENDAKKFVDYTLNKELQLEQRMNAKNKAVHNFSLEVAVNKYCNLFEKIIK